MDAVSAAALGASAWTALMILERAQAAGAQIEGAHVLVVGATGSVGQCALQLARSMGAARVIAAGRDRARLGARSRARRGRDGRARRRRARRDGSPRPAAGVSTSPSSRSGARPPGRSWRRSPTAACTSTSARSAGTDAELPSLPLRNRRISVVGHSGAWTTPQQRIEAFERIQAIAIGDGLTLDVEELPLDDVPEGWRRLQGSAGRKLVARPAA